MSHLSRIFGWTPPDTDDLVDVPDPLFPQQNPTFHILDASTSNFGSASPASSTSALSADVDLPSERRPEVTGKHGDPSWVARPRNEFILFRCDYVRRHSRDGKRARRAPGAEAEPTLSKQAAEAWHHLPPEERLYWKERANGERNEHARRYPDYRYRPRRNAAGRRRVSRASGNNPSSPDSAPSEPSTPTTVRPDERTPTHSRHCSQPQIPVLKPTQPRRAASVPDIPATEPQVTRRLRSTASQSWIPIPPPAQASVLETPSFTPSQAYDSIPSQIPDATDFEQPVFSNAVYSPSSSQSPTVAMQSSSSSLVNWNGALVSPQPMHPMPSTAALSRVIALDSSGSHLTEYSTGGTPLAHSELFDMVQQHYQPNGDVWVPQMQPYHSDSELVQTADFCAPFSIPLHW